MSLCVCGWYYRQSFYDRVLDWVLKRRQATVVTHRDPTIPLPCPHIRATNIGLEWHAYNTYLQNAWDGKGPVLFLHDDTEIEDSHFFDAVEEHCASMDVAFIFRDQEEARMNGKAHGRCAYMSRALLEKFQPIGFWYDETNSSDTQSARCNQGIQHFIQDIGWLIHRPGGTTIRWGAVILGGADFGYRGQLGEAGSHYRLTHFKS